MSTAKITVNPRYGMFDLSQNRVVPITNTIGSPSPAASPKRVSSPATPVSSSP
jgi:hypothetical protein